MEKGEVMVVQRRGGWGQRKTQPPSTHQLTIPPPHSHTHTHTQARADRAEVTSDVTTRAEGGEGEGQAREAGRKPPGKQVHSVNTLGHLLLWVCEGGPEHPRGEPGPWAGWWGAQPGPGHQPSNPLQYSCLGNPTDRGAWRAPVHGLLNSWTQLSD